MCAREQHRSHKNSRGGEKPQRWAVGVGPKSRLKDRMLCGNTRIRWSGAVVMRLGIPWGPEAHNGERLPCTRTLGHAKKLALRKKAGATSLTCVQRTVVKP